MPIVRDILCAIDFSPTAERAATFAAELAAGLGAHVHLAHVLPIAMPTMPMPEIGVAPQEVIAPPSAQLAEDARRALGRLADDLGLEPRLHVVTGSASREIVRLAREIGADAIVVGTHGRTGLAHMLLGSVAERVVRTSSVPVLVVPPERRS